MLSCTAMVGSAMHRSPAQPKAALMIPRAVRSTGASSSTNA
jgi:hypothetical protein